MKKKNKCKSVDLPMKEEHKAMVNSWKNMDLSLSPIRVVYKQDHQGNEGFTFEPSRDGGSNQERNDLIHASLSLATGAKSSLFGNMLIDSCVAASGLVKNSKRKAEINSLNAILDTLYAMKPNDEIEGMLITRLIALHFQITKQMQALNLNDLTSEQVDSLINRSTKLTRLYNETVDTLSRYRRKGEQKVVVQHVNVNDGGQAMVGNFQAGVGKKL